MYASEFGVVIDRKYALFSLNMSVVVNDVVFDKLLYQPWNVYPVFVGVDRSSAVYVVLYSFDVFVSSVTSSKRTLSIYISPAWFASCPYIYIAGFLVFK